MNQRLKFDLMAKLIQLNFWERSTFWRHHSTYAMPVSVVVGDYALDYGFWGRLNGIHMLGDALTDEMLLVIFLVIWYQQKVQNEKDEQAERERHAKLVLEGKKQVR